MNENYVFAIKQFLQNYQSDEELKRYRQFVNVYNPREEDVQAVYAGMYELKDPEIKPNTYGEGNMIEFIVGKTTYRIWGEAAKYVEDLANI